MPAQPLIHIGYHKTGTTWLQKGLFQNESFGYCRISGTPKLRELLVLPTPFEFDSSSAREYFLPLAASASEKSLIPVLSDERLSGSPHAGGYDSAQIADRLLSVFPDARVLIVIREQRTAVYSLYQQFIRDGGATSLRFYLFPRNQAEVPAFRFSHLEYHFLIRYYLDRFGKDRVLVLPYEWLRQDEIGFLNKINSFVGLPDLSDALHSSRYVSFNALAIYLKRWANFFFVRNALNPSAPFYVKNHEQRFERIEKWLPKRFSHSLEKKMRAQIESVIGCRYAKSNRETERLLDLDLKALGYIVD